STLSGIVALDLQSILFLFQMCLVIAVLSALAILPIMAIAVTQKGYVLPVCMTLVYIFLGFFITPVNMYLHPISSISAVIASSGKIPGLTFTQEINAFWMMLCIFCWDVLSVLLAYFSLSRRK
ncbi:MAG TPA: ABC transporter permease, partial [Candidatus Butyricimonas faecavium]|nr:ABC transporter permease [Candidatus Butyricimonas faecavium]